MLVHRQSSLVLAGSLSLDIPGEPIGWVVQLADIEMFYPCSSDGLRNCLPGEPYLPSKPSDDLLLSELPS